MYYSSEITAQMRKLYQFLSEKYKRRYAAIEAQKLDCGGINYIARILSADRNTMFLDAILRRGY